MTDNLFQDTDEPKFDQNKDYLSDLVGEGKKYKDAEALAKSYAHADATISTLTRKMDELRSDYLKIRDDNLAKDKLQELIDRLEDRKNDTSADTQNADEDKSGLKLEDVESLFSSKLEQYEQSKKERENFNTVQAKLQERYGEQVQSFLKEQMNTLGLSKDDINSMARTRPQILIKALGLDAPAKTESLTSPPRSSVRNDSFQPKAGQKRTWSYYQEMRKKDPGLYYDPKINVQMQNDMLELGDDFKDGDFYS